MNLFALTGNLGKDCRTNNVNGTAVCNFPVAVKSGYGDKEQTIWLDCALWGKRAEGKQHNAAVMCLARRRCDVILAMLRNRTPYKPPEPITDVAKAA